MVSFITRLDLIITVHSSTSRCDASTPLAAIPVESSLISREPARADVTNCAVPATKMATDAGVKTLANMLLIGKLLHEVDLADDELVDKVLSKVVSAKHADLLDLNKQAIKLGYDYED